MLDLKIAFTDKEITPWSGIVLVKKMLDRISFDEQLNKLRLPLQDFNRGYDPSQLIKQFMTSIWCGDYGKQLYYAIAQKLATKERTVFAKCYLSISTIGLYKK